MGRVPLGASARHTARVSSIADVVDHPWHLMARFFTSLLPTPPSIAAESWADEQLLASEREMWIRLSNQDRRHSVAVAQRFAAVRPEATRAELAGALLHDVGKIECRLGTFGRVAATLLGPRTIRFRAYHDHEQIGADMAAHGGSDPATVELVAGHGPAFAQLEECDY